MKSAARARVGLILGALALVLIFGSAPAYAATLSVNTIDDELNSDGDCSLREAMQAANTNLAVDACGSGQAAPTVDVITFSITGTILLGSPLPLIGVNFGQPTEAVTIDGPGAANLTISGGGAVHVFDVNVFGKLNLDDVTVANGSAFIGGAIDNTGTVIVTNTVFSGSSAGAGGGGAIFNNITGTFTLTNSTVSGNSASSGAGGIRNGGTLTITNSTISENSGSHGGGMDNSGTLTITNSTVSGNSASNLGGGIQNFSPGAVTITNSTFSANSAPVAGGILNQGLGGTLNISNTTFSGNSASLGSGGGILTGGMLTVTNSTFSGNSAFTVGGGIDSPIGTSTLRNTILANNAGGNCSGTVVDGLGNLQHPDATCGGTITSTDPLLDLLGLQDNGGPTRTIALEPGSPAIDAAVAANCPATDQRGVSRPQGAGCDVGAFEFEQGFNFTGFFAPLANPPVFNRVKAGSGIPVKFSLDGDQGLNIFVTGYPKSQQIDCEASATMGDPVSAVGSLSYDSASDRYLYAWKTAKGWMTTCRKLIVQLSDGSEHVAYFHFAK